MAGSLRGIVLFTLVCVAAAKLVDGNWETETPIVIGHRGAPSYRVEETFPSYELASNLHADFLETDLCVTQDSVLVNI
jgi:glycerophosphoryl diester phosphodiesterase